MKKSFPLVVLALLTLLSSCDLASGIFKAGVWIGVLVVVVIVGLIVWVASKFFGGGGASNP